MSEEIREGCAPSECGTKAACAGCSHNHSEQAAQPAKEPPRVRKVIGVMSGKGGVGKSLVSGELAVMLARMGYRVGILDADITGPSIPKMFGVHEKAQGCEDGLFPVETKSGIEIMSINLLLEDETSPVVWRGPVIAGVIKQFWSDVIWNEVDCMFVDLPPGTGDAPLTVFQSLPLDGIIIVTSPQELVSMIVSKAVEMAKLMNVPVLGLIENYSYVKCPCCGEPFKVYGESHIDEVAAKYGLKVLGKLPLDPQIASLCDRGIIELFDGDWLDKAADAVEAAHR